jgi:hypothetical protein
MLARGAKARSLAPAAKISATKIVMVAAVFRRVVVPLEEPRVQNSKIIVPDMTVESYLGFGCVGEQEWLPKFPVVFCPGVTTEW